MPANLGSLVSDRLQQQSKGKAKTPTPEPPKSKAVRTLEARLDGIRSSNGHTKDPKGGCFCQARTHALTSDVPMCQQCGLILCALNAPHHACPHCGEPLLDAVERAGLAARLEAALAAQIAKEAAERQRAIEEAVAAEGEFPRLPGSQTPRTKTKTKTTTTSSSSLAPSPATRTVLSLDAQTKKVTVSSYVVATPAVSSSRPASRGEDVEEVREGEGRVAAPPAEVSYVKTPLDPDRPWRNVRAGDVRYVPRRPEGDASGRSRRRKGGERETTGTG